MSADHDPLCELIAKPKTGLRRGWVCDCTRFAEVRADERQQARQRVFGLVERDPHPTRVVSVHDAAAAAGGDTTPPPEDHPST